MKKRLLYISFIVFFAACQSNSTKEKNTSKKTEQHHDHKNHEHHTTKVNHDCRHCGMPSQEFPKWKVKTVAEKGEVWYCSPRCMFINTLNKDKSPKGIKSIQVISYYDTKPIDAKTAFYVTGSDVLGPMGHDLIPLKDKAAAEDFKNEHKGQNILTFDQVNMKLIQALVDKK